MDIYDHIEAGHYPVDHKGRPLVRRSGYFKGEEGVSIVTVLATDRGERGERWPIVVMSKAGCIKGFTREGQPEIGDRRLLPPDNQGEKAMCGTVGLVVEAMLPKEPHIVTPAQDNPPIVDIDAPLRALREENASLKKQIENLISSVNALVDEKHALIKQLDAVKGMGIQQNDPGLFHGLRKEAEKEPCYPTGVLTGREPFRKGD